MWSNFFFTISVIVNTWIELHKKSNFDKETEIQVNDLGKKIFLEIFSKDYGLWIPFLFCLWNFTENPFIWKNCCQKKQILLTKILEKRILVSKTCWLYIYFLKIPKLMPELGLISCCSNCFRLNSSSNHFSGHFYYGNRRLVL